MKIRIRKIEVLIRIFSVFIFLFSSCETIHISYYGHFQKYDENPTILNKNLNGDWLADFRKDAFAQINLELSSTTDDDSVEIWLREQILGDSVIKKPIDNKIAEKFVLHLKRGTHLYSLNIEKKELYSPMSLIMPDSIGEVIPFRYCEIKNYNHKLTKKAVTRSVVTNIFNDRDSYFESSDTTLNQIYELCKHTMKATSFCGYFVDGNRERIPYEGDILINQLSWFAVSADYSIAKRTLEHIIENSTWPTEYIMQTLIIAWDYYMYSGDKILLEKYYETLKNKTLYTLRDEYGLIPTGDGIKSDSILKSVNCKLGIIRDMVDWPKCGDFDWGENSNIIDTTDFGEDDYYVYEKYNTVVNCFHYQAIKIFSQIARLLGKKDDEILFTNYAVQTYTGINCFFRNVSLYKDGKESSHKSLHANMMALLFGIVPDDNKQEVLMFIKSKGMACSVYGSQFLLDCLLDNNANEYALELLTKTDKRSWYNMIRCGSTITTEAWDDSYKPNQDWNHAWGAAPLNIIVRKIMGIQPKESGFKTVKIEPRPGNLKFAKCKLPTPSGIIETYFHYKSGKFELCVDLPRNICAEIILPNGNRFIHKGGKKMFNE